MKKYDVLMKTHLLLISHCYISKLFLFVYEKA